MKKLKNLLVCLLLAVCCVGFVACGNNNEVDLNTKPTVSINGDFKETESTEVETVIGTKSAMTVDNYSKYKVYMKMSAGEGYSQEAILAISFNEDNTLNEMAMKMVIESGKQNIIANCYYKDSMFYIDATSSMVGVNSSIKYKFNPTINYGSDFDSLTDMYANTADQITASNLLEYVFDAVENSEYFKLEKTDDNTKFKITKKSDVVLPNDLDFTDIDVEFEIKNGKLAQMKCLTVTDSVNAEVLLATTDQKIVFPNFDSYADISTVIS